MHKMTTEMFIQMYMWVRWTRKPQYLCFHLRLHSPHYRIVRGFWILPEMGWAHGIHGCEYEY